MNPFEPPTVAVAVKPFWTSKTIWFSVLSVALFVASLVAEQAGALNIPPQAVTILGIVIAAGNFILRLITTQPVGTSPDGAKWLPGAPVPPAETRPPVG